MKNINSISLITGTGIPIQSMACKYATYRINKVHVEAIAKL